MNSNVQNVDNNQLIIKEDIFEAIRSLEPNNALLNLNSSTRGILTNPREFQMLSLGNGKWCAIPKTHMLMTHYRGEPNEYETCVPSLFRNHSSEDMILINKLKILDFEDVCKTFPSVISSDHDGLEINYEAIAQHYGLKTSIIDITTDIGVAAFFATHKFSEENREYIPLGSGVGTIRVFSCLELNQYIRGYDGPEFQIIGIQPFYRTAMQFAQGCKCVNGHDLATCSSTIIFKQNEEMSRRIGSIFIKDGKNSLFPTEIISDAAKQVIESTSITKASVKRYCRENDVVMHDVENILERNGYSITSKSVFKLSRQQRRFLERQTNKEPYGGIMITTRLQWLSNETIDV